MIARALLLILLLMINGCVVGPNYVPPEPVVPNDWQNLQLTHNLSDEGFVKSFGTIGTDPTLGQGKYTLTNQECPWWLSFLDDDLIQLIELQRAQSPTLHEFRAAVDQAWHQRWVLKRGAYPHIELRGEHFQYILDRDLRSPGSRTHDNVYRADIGWEIDLFGGIQRQVEVTDRNLESQVEGWRNAVLFFVGEIGLFYTDLRVNEHRIDLQKQNIEFYEEVVQLVKQKVDLGGTAAIDLEEAKARLERERAALPVFERLRDNARVELARVVGVYSADVDKILSPHAAIPSPGQIVMIPKPAVVLPQRPDIRRQERRIAAQVARVSQEYAELYPQITAPTVINPSDTAEQVIARWAFGITGTLFKRIIHPERERALIREEQAILQRTIRDYETGLVDAAAEVEQAIVDVQSAYKQISALIQAVERNSKAFTAVYDAYRGGLVDVRDIIRIRNDYFDSQTELIFAQNLLAKSTVRLYKAIGGVDLPPIPAFMVPSQYCVTESSRGNHFLSKLFSLNRDLDKTLHTDRQQIRHENKNIYEVTLDGELRLVPPVETDWQRRIRDQ